MSIKASLRSDLTEAIRSRDEITSSTIRMVLTAITNEEVAGKEARVLSDDEIITVLSREAKNAVKHRRHLKMRAGPIKRHLKKQRVK